LTCGVAHCGVTNARDELRMDLANIKDAKEWFEVLQTSDRSQTAVMTLESGKSSGAKEGHKNSDQVLLLLEGELAGEVGNEKATLKKGDVLLIPASVKHRFTNRGTKPAVTFNVYAPPEYSDGTKG
jgi:mannose-6-phosphate isomerase-like protein (cupin superfamily)